MYENLAGRDCVMEEEQDSDAVDLGHTCISFTMAVQGLQGRHTWGYGKDLRLMSACCAMHS